MSDEHLWSDWMKPLFPQWNNPEYSEFWETHIGKERNIARRFERFRQGAPHRKKIKVVCERCNNGWMGVLETSVQSCLAALIRGESCSLSSSDRKKLSIWVALKTLVAEHNDYYDFRADPIFAQNIRDSFKDNPNVPPGFKIWIIPQQGGQKWILGYRRHAAGLIVSDVPPDYMGSPKNIQSITMGIGRVLISVLATTDSQVYQLLDLMGPTAPMRLWPLTENDISWPGNFAITDAGADQLAMVLDTLIASPNVRWAPPRVG